MRKKLHLLNGLARSWIKKKKQVEQVLLTEIEAKIHFYTTSLDLS